MKPIISPGHVVFSKKGRDKGRYFVVLYTVGAEFVMIADGETRKMDHLKKKRRKHLEGCPYEAPQLLKMAEAGTLKDSDIRSFLWPIANKTNGEKMPIDKREE